MTGRVKTMGILLEISAFIGVCTAVFLAIGLVNSIGRNDVVEKLGRGRSRQKNPPLTAQEAEKNDSMLL